MYVRMGACSQVARDTTTVTAAAAAAGGSQEPSLEASPWRRIARSSHYESSRREDPFHQVTVCTMYTAILASTPVAPRFLEVFPGRIPLYSHDTASLCRPAWCPRGLNSRSSFYLIHPLFSLRSSPSIESDISAKAHVCKRGSVSNTRATANPILLPTEVPPTPSVGWGGRVGGGGDGALPEDTDPLQRFCRN